MIRPTSIASWLLPLITANLIGSGCAEMVEPTVSDLLNGQTWRGYMQSCTAGPDYWELGGWDFDETALAMDPRLQTSPSRCLEVDLTDFDIVDDGPVLACIPQVPRCDSGCSDEEIDSFFTSAIPDGESLAITVHAVPAISRFLAPRSARQTGISAQLLPAHIVGSYILDDGTCRHFTAFPDLE